MVNYDSLTKRLINSTVSLHSIHQSLTDAQIPEYSIYLKDKVDKLRDTDLDQALDHSALIIKLGTSADLPGVTALGLMAHGDTLKEMGDYETAWLELNQAADLFSEVGDEVGWARTCIGRVRVSIERNVFQPFFDENISRAERILEENGEFRFLLGLQINLGANFSILGRLNDAHKYYDSAMLKVGRLAPGEERDIGLLHNNLAIIFHYLGDMDQAGSQYRVARDIFRKASNDRHLALAQLNLTNLIRGQGKYKEGLQRMQHMLDEIETRYPLEVLTGKSIAAELYHDLNESEKAVDFARVVVSGYEGLGLPLQAARARLLLGECLAGNKDYETALKELDNAIATFEAYGAAWNGDVYRLRADIAEELDELDSAYDDVQRAIEVFEEHGFLIKRAKAMLVKGQILLKQNRLSQAETAGDDVLQASIKLSKETLQYDAQVLLGSIEEKKQKPGPALKHYTKANNLLESIKLNLTLTTRDAFLSDKNEALNAMIRLNLDEGNTQEALLGLEQMKANVLFSYLNNRALLSWEDDSYSNKMQNELNAHRQLYKELDEQRHQLMRSHNRLLINRINRQIAEVQQQYMQAREQLYSFSNSPKNTEVISDLDQVQSRLAGEALLIEYHVDNNQIRAFIIEAGSLDVVTLPIGLNEVDDLRIECHINMLHAIEDHAEGSTNNQRLSDANRLLERLYDGLVSPLSKYLKGKSQINVVPYGSLHHLPFHLLRHESRYLIEDFEIILSPAASIVLRDQPVQTGSLILGYSKQGKYPGTTQAAIEIGKILRGEVLVEEKANVSVINQPSRQILHISAHGEYNTHNPELSHIDLEGGGLYPDDILQQDDLRYELITLGACETIRGKVAAQDELIGLRGAFLYAGAGTLVGSMWQIHEDFALQLLTDFYSALMAGQSKASAIRSAQLDLYQQDEDLHPAHWGAFQLVGNAGKLSSVT